MSSAAKAAASVDRDAVIDGGPVVTVVRYRLPAAVALNAVPR